MTTTIILCPNHGYLSGPYKQTIIHIGSNAVNNVVCAFCKECNSYYTTAMAVLIGKPEPIDGKPVLRGNTATKPPEGYQIIQYPNRPFLRDIPTSNASNPNMAKTPMRLSKQTVVFSKNTVNRLNNRKIKEYKDIYNSYIQTTEEVSGTQNGYRFEKVDSSLRKNHISIANTFYVSNVIDTISNKVCPLCRSTLSSKRFNLPIYSDPNTFKGFYVSSLFRCDKCSQLFITIEQLEELQRKLNQSGGGHFSPKNAIVKKTIRSCKYLYDPIIDSDIYINRNDKNRSKTELISSLNDTSILSNYGYSTSLDTFERREILKKVVIKYGKRKTTDLLRFFIRTRIAQENGSEKYSRAISIWQDDMAYVAKI